MSIDNHACLILGLNTRQINFEKIDGFQLIDYGIDEAVNWISENKKINLSYQMDNKDETYIGFTLARTKSYGMCEVVPFDENGLGSIFVGLFGIAPKLWLIEQQD